MKLVKSVDEFLLLRRNISKSSVGFVPTMGALHLGHESLLKESISACELTILSIYINPTQFNNAQDLENYPDTIDADLALAEKVGVDIVFLPSYSEMYPDGFKSVSYTHLTLPTIYSV